MESYNKTYNYSGFDFILNFNTLNAIHHMNRKLSIQLNPLNIK